MHENIEKISIFWGEEIRPNELTQFPLQDHVSIFTYRNEHYLYKIDFFFNVFMHFELPDMPMVLSTFPSLNAFHFRTSNAHNFPICERKHQVCACIFLVRP